MAMAVMMISQDPIPKVCVVEEACNNSCLDFCDERQDMWSLIKPELQANSFSSLLSGAPGNAAATPWDLVTLKPYGRSRSSLSNDSLQLCTEGLGCESSDCLTDCSCSSCEFADDYLSDDEEDQEIIDTVKKGADAAPARAFPPPLASISACNPSYMRSFKKDGRFVLRSVKAPLQSNNFLHSYREGGRLKMQLISRNDDDVPLLQASNPEAEIDQEEPEEAADEEHQDLEAESGSCFWDSDEVPVSENFSDTAIAGFEPVSSDEPFPATIHFSDAVFNGGFATAGFKVPRNSSPERTSNSKLNEFQDQKKSSDTRPAGKQRQGSSCVNAYSGWRTSAGKATSKVSSGLYHKSLVNYRAKDGAPLEFNVNVNANECFGHCPLRRCHEPTKPLSVWGESQCIATSS